MKVTVEFDPTSAEDVERAQAVVARFGVPTTDEKGGSFMPLWNRIGDGAAELLKLAKKHTKPGGSFTFESLEAASNVPASRLKAWHRNLSRSVKSLGDKAPVLFTEKWDGTRQHYTLTDEARAAIV
jgi:hypothetical protein